jgi:single-strand DNA-binding protein
MFETYLTVVGRVISEPSLRTVSSGDKVCSFRMIATERRFNRESQEWGDGDKLFVQVSCWRKLAENVQVSVLKGDQVIVSGRVFVRQWSDTDGQQRQVLELEAKAVGPNLMMVTAMITRPNREWSDSEEVITPSAIAA